MEKQMTPLVEMFIGNKELVAAFDQLVEKAAVVFGDKLDALDAIGETGAYRAWREREDRLDPNGPFTLELRDRSAADQEGKGK